MPYDFPANFLQHSEKPAYSRKKVRFLSDGGCGNPLFSCFPLVFVPIIASLFIPV